MLAAVHGEQPDRLPVSPWGFGKVPIESAVGQELLDKTDPFVDIGLGCDPVGGALWAPVEAVVGAKRRVRVTLADRELTATFTTTLQTTAATEYLCKSADDLRAVMAAPYVEPAPDLAAYHALRARIGERGLVILGFGTPLNYLHDMLGPELCCRLWADEPDLLVWAAEIAAKRTARVIERACAGGVDCLRFYGGEYATELMGPRAWERLVVPFDQPLVKLIHSFGGLAHYHNHGRMSRWIERIAALGVDSLDPVEQPPYGDLPMAEAWRRVGSRMCLVGGLDDMEVLETRPWGEVEALARQVLESVGKTRFMLGGTSSSLFGERGARHFIRLASLVLEYS